MKKYKLTGETKLWFDRTLYRIRALIDIQEHGVKKGDLGGWIETEENLSHDGAALVSGSAVVGGSARVGGTAVVSGLALVGGSARVSSSAQLLTVGPIGSMGNTITFFNNANKKIMVSCGGFRGDIDQFVAHIRATHGDSKHARAYLAAVELAKIQIDSSAAGNAVIIP